MSTWIRIRLKTEFNTGRKVDPDYRGGRVCNFFAFGPMRVHLCPKSGNRPIKWHEAKFGNAGGVIE